MRKIPFISTSFWLSLPVFREDLSLRSGFCGSCNVQYIYLLKRIPGISDSEKVECENCDKPLDTGSLQRGYLSTSEPSELMAWLQVNYKNKQILELVFTPYSTPMVKNALREYFTRLDFSGSFQRLDVMESSIPFRKTTKSEKSLPTHMRSLLESIAQKKQKKKQLDQDALLNNEIKDEVRESRKSNPYLSGKFLASAKDALKKFQNAQKESFAAHRSYLNSKKAKKSSRLFPIKNLKDESETGDNSSGPTFNLWDLKKRKH